MKSRWLCAAIVVVLLVGCQAKSEPPSEPAEKSSIFGEASVAGPGMTDEFGLPLVIVLNPPEVPKHLLRPSRPIAEEQKTTPIAPPETTPKKTPKTTPKSPSPGGSKRV
jgi:hypothetical protein